MILDIGFCVLEGIIELRKMGVYAGALIKKRRYWPKHVPGELINEYLKDKEVGSNNLLHGTFGGVKYDFFCMKEPDYVLKPPNTVLHDTMTDDDKKTKSTDNVHHVATHHKMETPVCRGKCCSRYGMNFIEYIMSTFNFCSIAIEDIMHECHFVEGKDS